VVKPFADKSQFRSRHFLQLKNQLMWTNYELIRSYLDKTSYAKVVRKPLISTLKAAYCLLCNPHAQQ